jgi:three-Cys-motif partner protein
VKDDNSKLWDIPEHTRAKHQLLDRYLGGWYPILSKWSRRVLYIDGFAGRGRYNDGSEGSPLVAIKRLLDHRHLPAMQNTEFVSIPAGIQDQLSHMTQLVSRTDIYGSLAPQAISHKVASRL